MPTLSEIAGVRSKNAGPFGLCLDMIFKDPDMYRRVRDSGAVSAKAIAALYHVPENQCMFTCQDAALTIKCTIPRLIAAGTAQDNDMYGSQQALPLELLEIDLP